MRMLPKSARSVAQRNGQWVNTFSCGLSRKPRRHLARAAPPEFAWLDDGNSLEIAKSEYILVYRY